MHAAPIRRIPSLRRACWTAQIACWRCITIKACRRSNTRHLAKASISRSACRSCAPRWIMALRWIWPARADHSAGNEEISLFAMSLVDVPYRWGGNTPESGFDCSGLVRYVIERAAHINLPRTAREMSAQGKRITPDQVAPGDLIFFNTNGHPNSHVGIYVGHHRFVNAPSSGSLVRIDHVDAPYWARHFNGIR